MENDWHLRFFLASDSISDLSGTREATKKSLWATETTSAILNFSIFPHLHFRRQSSAAALEKKAANSSCWWQKLESTRSEKSGKAERKSLDDEESSNEAENIRQHTEKKSHLMTFETSKASSTWSATTSTVDETAIQVQRVWTSHHPMKTRKMLNSRSETTTASHHQNHHNVSHQQQCSGDEQRQASTLTRAKAPTHQQQHEHELLSSESDISSVLRLQLRNRLTHNRNYAHVRRKTRWNCNIKATTTGSTMLLLMLMCIAVRMELVIGALSVNYNSVNYYDNTTAVAFSDESDLVPFLDDDDNTLTNRSTASMSSRPPIIYHNEFALYIPSGLSNANEIAEKYGFINMGQVSVTVRWAHFGLC